MTGSLRMHDISVSEKSGDVVVFAHGLRDCVGSDSQSREGVTHAKKGSVMTTDPFTPTDPEGQQGQITSSL